MLDLLRKKQKSFILKSVFWLIIAAFVGTIFLVWGRGSDRGGNQQAALKVNDRSISYQRYQQAYSNLYDFYQKIYKERFTPELEKRLNLKGQAVESLIQRTLLLELAEKKNLQVSEKEVVEAIAQIPAFQVDGSFQRQRYLQVLQYQRVKPKEFEAQQRRQLLIKKVRQKLQENVSVSADEIRQAFKQRNAKRSLAYLQFQPDQFIDQVDVTDAGLQTYYKNNQEQFRQPERISLRYLEFNPEDYKQDILFDAEELKDYYHSHLDDYEIPEQVRARHILLQVPQNASTKQVSQVRQKAEKLRQQLLKGADFAKLAQQHSDDAATKNDGGALGLLTRSDLEKPLQQAAFDLETGSLSQVVKSSKGFHIIQVQEHIQAGIKPLEEVKSQVKQRLRRSKARQQAMEKAMDAYHLNRKEGSIEQAAQRFDKAIHTTGLFTRQEAIPGIGESSSLKQKAFALHGKEVAKPQRVNGSVYLVSLKARHESHIPPLEDIRSQVKAAYQQKQAQLLAQQAAEQALKEAPTQENGLEAFAMEQRPVQTTDMFTQAFGGFIPGLGEAPQLVDKAFASTLEKPYFKEVQSFQNSYLVLKLHDVQPSPMDKLNAEKRQQLRQELLQKKQQQAVQKRVEELRQKAKIHISPRLQQHLQEQ